MKTVLKIILVILFFSGLFGGIYYLYQKNNEKPVVFETESPLKTDIVKKTVATGSVVPRQEIEIKPQISGIVSVIYKEPGDIVKKGDVLVKVKIIPDMVSLNNAEDRVDRALLTLENAEKDYDRNKGLLDQGVIATADFQPIELAKKNAQLEVEAARNNLQLIKEGVTKKAGNATNTLIRATISGMILDIPIEEGNSVIESNTFNDGTTIATIADMTEMVFEGKIDESEVGKLHLNMALILNVGAIEQEKFDATLEYISPKGVEEEGAIQFEIRAAVLLKDSVTVRAGYSANADIVLARKDNVLAINERLLIFKNDSVFAEVEVGDQEFEKRLLEIGLSDGINIEVLSGISEGDKLKVQE